MYHENTGWGSKFYKDPMKSKNQHIMLDWLNPMKKDFEHKEIIQKTIILFNMSTIIGNYGFYTTSKRTAALYNKVLRQVIPLLYDGSLE